MSATIIKAVRFVPFTPERPRRFGEENLFGYPVVFPVDASRVDFAAMLRKAVADGVVDTEVSERHRLGRELRLAEIEAVAKHSGASLDMGGALRKSGGDDITAEAITVTETRFVPAGERPPFTSPLVSKQLECFVGSKAEAVAMLTKAVEAGAIKANALAQYDAGTLAPHVLVKAFRLSFPHASVVGTDGRARGRVFLRGVPSRGGRMECRTT